MVQKFDIRQSVSRDFLDQLTLNSDYIAAVVGGKDANSTEADNLMRSINDELTVPLRMSASNTPDLVITLDGAQITNSETGRGRSLPPIDGVVPSFAGGTITFPATDAGNITPSVGTAIAVTTTAGNFNKLGVFLNSAGEIVLVEGTEGATIAAAVAPGEEPGMLYVGYIQFGVDGGGNITGSDTTPAVLPNTDVFQLPILGSGISAIINQDRGIKLLSGGNWALSTPSGVPTDYDNGLTNNTTYTNTNLVGDGVAQSFVATGTSINSADNFGLTNSGAATGTLRGYIYTDNAGAPDTVVATSTNTIDISTLPAIGPFETAAVTFNFSGEAITPATTYWFGWIVETFTGGTAVRTTGQNGNPIATASNIRTGGFWSGDFGTGIDVHILTNESSITPSSLTWDADAYIQVPGLANNENIIPLAASGISLGTDQVAYVDINRIATAITGNSTDLTATLNVVDVDAFVPTDDRVIFARENDGSVIVGDDSFRLIPGESQTLEASASNETLTLLGSGVTEATSTPTYSTRTPAAPQRTLDDSQAMLEAMSSMDVEIDKFFGQLRLQPHGSDAFRATITGVDLTMKDGSILSQEVASLVMEFDGAIINFATGEVRSADDLSSLGTLFTPAALAIGDYRWYSVALVANTQDATTEAMEVTFVILPGSSDDAVAADAPYAPFGGSKKVGQVQVQNVAGTITVGTIRQLGVGAGGGGNDQDRNLKLIEGGTWSVTAGPTLSWDADAYVQVPGVSNTRNTLSTNPGIVIPNGSVAFVEINRLAGAVDTPTITVDTIENVNQYSSDLLIFARGVSDGIIVGNNSFLLKVGESLELEGALAEINRYHDQFRIRTTSNTNEVSVESAETSMLDGTTLRQELNGFVVDFTGATIDFTAGTAGINATGLSPITTAIGTDTHYQWFGIGLLPDSVGVDGRMTPQFVITAGANSDAVQASAPYPVISGDKKIGAVLLQRSGTDAIVVEISRFSVGASGGAQGDANSIVETLKNQLNCSYYDAVTANVFSIDEEDKLDTGTSTGEYSLVTNNFEMDAAETMVSTQMLDAQFLASPSVLVEVDLSMFWDLATIDTAATYEVSRDGGNEYQAVTMDRHNTTEVYTGNHVFTEEAATQQLAADAATDGTFEMDNVDEYVSQAFTLVSTSVIKDVDMTVTVNGSPVGELYVALYTDNAGDPDTLITESVATDISAMASGAVTLDIPDTALAAGTYHMVLRTSAAYKTAFVASTTSIEFDTNTAAATPLQSSPDGTTWTPEGEGFTYDLQGSVMDLRVRVTASAATQLAGYGILYEPTVSGTVNGVKNRQSFFFNASDNLNEFTLTTFTPDADLLSVYLVETGQVFKIGAFTLDGRTIRFPVNTFDNGGTPTPYTLIADQTIGNSFDNSDLNGLLLTGNHLGSTDALVDKSLPGRGIFLRRPDGTLRELTIDDADNIVIYSV